MAYLIGQLGNWLPVPGGIGGSSSGSSASSFSTGCPPSPRPQRSCSTVIELWIPAVLGSVAFVQLRLLLRRETEAIKLCKPEDTIGIVGLGPATIDRSEAESDRERPGRSPLRVRLQTHFACSQQLAPRLDRDEPQGQVEGSAVELLGELCDRCQPLYEQFAVEWALHGSGWVCRIERLCRRAGGDHSLEVGESEGSRRPRGRDLR